MFQSLLKSLSHFGQKHPIYDVAASHAARRDAVVRFESLIGELHLAAAQIAVVTSGVNALQVGIRLKNALSLQDIAPHIPDADSIALSPSCRQHLDLAADKISDVRDLFRELVAAQEDVEMFCTDADELGQEEAALDLRGVADRWRRLSVRALAAVISLEPDVARALPSRYGENTPLLKRLLRNAIDGGHPCVSSDAILKLPDLPQRRAAIRPNVRMSCSVAYQGMTFRAAIKDISTGGVGLEDAPPLRPQTVVLLEFDDGHCLSGQVVWSAGSRAGVKFDVPLEPDHQLLAQSTA